MEKRKKGIDEGREGKEERRKKGKKQEGRKEGRKKEIGALLLVGPG